jgi:hypothetical protein
MPKKIQTKNMHNTSRNRGDMKKIAKYVSRKVNLVRYNRNFVRGWVGIHLNAGRGRSHGNYYVFEKVKSFISVFRRFEMDESEVVNNLDVDNWTEHLEHPFQCFFI